KTPRAGIFSCPITFATPASTPFGRSGCAGSSALVSRTAEPPTRTGTAFALTPPPLRNEPGSGGGRPQPWPGPRGRAVPACRREGSLRHDGRDDPNGSPGRAPVPQEGPAGDVARRR